MKSIHKGKIKAILFDVGGTLIDVQPSVGHVYSKVAAKYHLKTDPKILNQRFFNAWKQEVSPDHRINKMWWLRLVANVFKPYQSPVNPELFEDIYEMFRKKETWKIYADVKPVLKKMKSRGYITAVASNWDSRLPELLKTLGLNTLFDHQFISFKMKFQKPQTQFFKAILSKLKLDPNEVLHVGDDETNDFHCPQKLGIRAMLIDRRKENGTPAETLRTLKDILSRF